MSNHLPRPALPSDYTVLWEDEDGDMLVHAPHNLLIIDATGAHRGNVFIGGAAKEVAAKLLAAAMGADPALERVEVLDLDARTIYALRRNGIETIEHLCAFSYDELSDLRNVGFKRLESLCTQLQRMGLKLRDEAPPVDEVLHFDATGQLVPTDEAQDPGRGQD
jgi:hypothetical protein